MWHPAIIHAVYARTSDTHVCRWEVEWQQLSYGAERLPLTQFVQQLALTDSQLFTRIWQQSVNSFCTSPAGCMPLDPETALAAMDLRLMCGYIAAMREVLPDPAAPFPSPEARLRVERLVAAWRAYITPFVRLSTYHMIHVAGVDLDPVCGTSA